VTRASRCSVWEPTPVDHHTKVPYATRGTHAGPTSSAGLSLQNGPGIATAQRRQHKYHQSSRDSQKRRCSPRHTTAGTEAAQAPWTAVSVSAPNRRHHTALHGTAAQGQVMQRPLSQNAKSTPQLPPAAPPPTAAHACTAAVHHPAAALLDEESATPGYIVRVPVAVLLLNVSRGCPLPLGEL
jgi:hypothetical protein